MDPVLILGVVIGLYAVMGLLGLIMTRAMARGQLADLSDEMSPAAGFVASYGDGLRGAVWAAAIVAYGLAAVLTMAKSADALWVFVGALSMDFGLFLTWRQRASYVAHLRPNERLGEMAAVAMLSACLIALVWLKARGALI
jgi:hypothetical protein